MAALAWLAPSLAPLFFHEGSYEVSEEVSEPLAVEPAQAAPQDLPIGIGRSLLERLPSGIVILDQDGRIAFVNERATSLFGRRLLAERRVSAIRVPDLLDAVEEASATGHLEIVDFRLTREQEIDLHAYVIPLDVSLMKSEMVRRPAMMIVLEDHTAARRAEQLQRDFVANASHELKTPLASILGFIETLQGHAKSDEEARERFLEIMHTQTMRMKRLVEDLLSLNRIELNEHVAPREPVPLKRIVWEVGQVLMPIAERRGMTVTCEPATDEPAVLGERDELAQVFINLIDNAIKYGNANSEIRVFEADPRPVRAGMVGISISDQSQGIAREHLPRLTERFYRVSVPKSRERGGTGLGLAIVKHILNRHRGLLDVESIRGEGSVFTVWLPRAIHSLRSVPKPAEGNPAPNAPADETAA